MKRLPIWRSVFLATALMLAASPVMANSNDDAFWNAYNAGRYSDDDDDYIGNQQNTEALINEMRAARGKPPCSIAPFQQWLKGRPAC